MANVGRPKKFEAPQGNPYSNIIQSTGEEQPEPEVKQEFYRFSLKLPIECKDYLQEMAWRNRISITEYMTRIVTADMEAHPEWTETIDILNK